MYLMPNSTLACHPLRILALQLQLTAAGYEEHGLAHDERDTDIPDGERGSDDRGKTLTLVFADVARPEYDMLAPTIRNRQPGGLHERLQLRALVMEDGVRDHHDGLRSLPVICSTAAPSYEDQGGAVAGG